MPRDFLNLSGRVALVTGVGRPRGIGACVAKVLTEHGCKVAMTDLDKAIWDRINEIRRSNYECEGFQVDLTDLEAVHQMAKAVVSKFGHIDVLVNVAGKSVPPRPPFLEMSPDYWELVMDRNLLTTVNCCWAVLPYMVNQKYGRIINISSITGPKCAYRYSAAYAASKGAISGLTRALALEMGEHGINVNAVLPGDVDTGVTPWHLGEGRRDLGRLSAHLTPPLARPGKAEEMADLVVYLASERSSYITGAELIIDGGATIVEPLPGAPQ